MKPFVIRYSLFLIFNLGLVAAYGMGIPQKENEIPVLKDRMRKVFTIGAPEEGSVDESRFYDLRGMTISPDDRLYLLDSQNGSIIVLSAETGDELFRFGRLGGGPGEFSKLTTCIRYVENRGIIVIDNQLRRATLFDKNGTVLETYPLRWLTDDLAFLSDEDLIVSRFLLKPDIQPLHIISAKTGKINRRFGSILEPLDGIFNKVKNSPFAASDIELFSHGWMTKIIFLEKTQRLFFFQSHPYAVCYYDLGKNDFGTYIQAPVPFPTEFFIDYSVKEETRNAKLLPTSTMLAPSLLDSFVVVPILSPKNFTKREDYLDFYSITGKFVKRFLLPFFSPDTGIGAVVFDSKKNMYLLLRNEGWTNWIEKYEFHLD
jgi:hypothetical protein